MATRPPTVHYRLCRASPAIKVLTTGSLLLVLTGIAVIIYFAIEQSGLTPSGLAAHYRGSEQESLDQLHFAIGRDELLRITHVHTFAMAMLLYIFGHMFTLTGHRERTKVAWIAAMFAGLAAFLASLWLIAYASTLFVWLFLAGFATALTSLSAISLAILWEIWLARPPPVGRPEGARLAANGTDSP